MNKLVVIYLVFLSCALHCQNKSLADYGVELSFTFDSNSFPKSWLTLEVNGKALSLDSTEYERSKQMIIKALNKYPVEVIKKHLKKIYVFKRLEFFGVPYGGTNSNSAVYITNKGLEKGYSDFWLEQTFHAEFSSIIFRNFAAKFDKQKWMTNNDNIQYGSSGHVAIQNGVASTKFDPELIKKGVLTQYSKASIEEDFNIFAGNLFLSSEGFWEACKTEKRIANKMDLVIQLYKHADKIFTEQYFRDISKK